MKKLYIYMRAYLSLIFIITAIWGNSQAYKYTFKSPNYANDTIIIGVYTGDKQLATDTLLRQKNRSFVLQGDKKISKGFYLALVKPSNNIFQFIINDESSFELTFDTTNYQNVIATGSIENKIFYDYLSFLSVKRQQVEKLREEQTTKQKNGLNTVQVDAAIDNVNIEVQQTQSEIVAKYPKSAAALLINTVDENITIPEELQKDTTTQGKTAQYLYYKNRYFEKVDFQSPMLINTSFGFQKIETYFSRLVSNESDSIIKELDIVLKKLKGNEDAIRFLLPNWLNKYGNGKVIGNDAVYVHLVDNYFTKGWAPWIDETQMETLVKYADEWRPILIGKNFPKIITYEKKLNSKGTIDSFPSALYNVNAPYTLAVFWAHDCGHCSKSMPYIVKWEEKYRAMGVKVFAVCTNAYDKEGGCFPALKEKNMENFINTSDYYQTYRRLVSIPQTPKLFILDKDKKILFKEFDAEKIDQIFEEVIRIEGQKGS